MHDSGLLDIGTDDFPLSFSSASGLPRSHGVRQEEAGIVDADMLSSMQAPCAMA